VVAARQGGLPVNGKQISLLERPARTSREAAHLTPRQTVSNQRATKDPL
jgi:hypothetical protein